MMTEKWMETQKPEEKILVAVKTPLMPNATTAFLPPGLTLSECLLEIRKIPPKDECERRIQIQIGIETSGTYEFLIVKQGIVQSVSPGMVLAEIAEPREVRTPRGLTRVPTAQFEVQAYARVGGVLF
ncbi:MAG: hypothetical protein C4576_35345 [Desulfobacteraceae bacterium]|nr:MAG: hypothetical protein C4576_35345 [Desulfobacteraceae bacterium]